MLFFCSAIFTFAVLVFCFAIHFKQHFRFNIYRFLCCLKILKPNPTERLLKKTSTPPDRPQPANENHCVCVLWVTRPSERRRWADNWRIAFRDSHLGIELQRDIGLFPALYLAYIFLALVLSIVIYANYSTLFHSVSQKFALVTVCNLNLSWMTITRGQTFVNASGHGSKPALAELLIIYGIFLTSSGESFLNYYRYSTIMNPNRKFNTLTSKQIVMRFAFFVSTFLVIFSSQLFFDYFYFPFVIVMHGMFNTYCVVIIRRLLLDYCRAVEQRRGRFGVDSVEYTEDISVKDISDAAYQMTRFSMLALLFSVAYLSCLTVCYNIHIVLCVPILVSLQTLLYTFNFSHNRQFISDIKHCIQSRICEDSDEKKLSDAIIAEPNSRDPPLESVGVLSLGKTGSLSLNTKNVSVNKSEEMKPVSIQIVEVEAEESIPLRNSSEIAGENAPMPLAFERSLTNESNHRSSKNQSQSQSRPYSPTSGSPLTLTPQSIEVVMGDATGLQVRQNSAPTERVVQASLPLTFSESQPQPQPQPRLKWPKPTQVLSDLPEVDDESEEKQTPIPDQVRTVLPEINITLEAFHNRSQSQNTLAKQDNASLIPEPQSVPVALSVADLRVLLHQMNRQGWHSMRI
jgi:hypothetical protein